MKAKIKEIALIINEVVEEVNRLSLGEQKRIVEEKWPVKHVVLNYVLKVINIVVNIKYMKIDLGLDHPHGLNVC